MNTIVTLTSIFVSTIVTMILYNAVPFESADRKSPQYVTSRW